MRQAREGEAAAAGVLGWAVDRARPRTCLVVSTHLHGLERLCRLDGCEAWRILPERRYVVQPGFTRECAGLELLRKCMPDGVVRRAEAVAAEAAAAEAAAIKAAEVAAEAAAAETAISAA